MMLFNRFFLLPAIIISILLNSCAPKVNLLPTITNEVPKQTLEIKIPTQIPTHPPLPEPSLTPTFSAAAPTVVATPNIALDPGVNYLVYARDEPMLYIGEGLVYSLWALVPGGREVGPLFVGAGPETRVSPDCSYMTFFPELETAVSTDAPVILDLNLGDLSNLDDIHGFVSIDWSPDSKWIVTDEEDTISLMNLTSGASVILKACKDISNPSSPSDCYSPSWEPEGGRIAYYAAFLNSGESDKLHGVYLVNADCSTGGLGCVSEGPLPLSEVFAWSPDGSKFAFEEFQSIKVFDLSKNQVIQEFKVSSNGTSSYISSIVWAPDASSLIYSMDFGIYRLDLVTGEQQVLAMPDMDQDGAPLAKEVLFWEDGACLEKISNFSR